MDVRYPTSPSTVAYLYFQLRHLYPQNAKFDSVFFFPFLATLYNTIYQYLLNSPHIAELTVEDPAEAFEDLRDRNDLKMLLNHEQFMREALGDAWAGSTHGGPVRNQRDREHHHVHPVHHTHAIHSRRHGEGTNGRKKQGEGKLSPPTEKAWAARWKAEFKIAQVRFVFVSVCQIQKYLLRVGD